MKKSVVLLLSLVLILSVSCVSVQAEASADKVVTSRNFRDLFTWDTTMKELWSDLQAYKNLDCAADEGNATTVAVIICSDVTTGKDKNEVYTYIFDFSADDVPLIYAASGNVARRGIQDVGPLYGQMVLELYNSDYAKYAEEPAEKVFGSELVPLPEYAQYRANGTDVLLLSGNINTANNYVDVTYTYYDEYQIEHSYLMDMQE